MQVYWGTFLLTAFRPSRKSAELQPQIKQKKKTLTKEPVSISGVKRQWGTCTLLADADADTSRGKQSGDELRHCSRNTLNLRPLGVRKPLVCIFWGGNGKNYCCFRQDVCGGSGQAVLGWKALGGEHGLYMALTLPSWWRFSSCGPGDLPAGPASVSVGLLETNVF